MISRRRLSTAAVIVACAGAAVALGGCGAGNAVDPVAKAAAVSTRAPGYQLLMSMQLNTSALPKPISLTGQGSFAAAARSGSLNLTMDLSGIPQATQALGTSTLRMDEVISGLNFYIKFPSSLASRLPGHKPWLKINLASLGRTAGIPGLSSLASNPASTDPSQFLRYLRASSGGVTKVGSEAVDGFQTTHYRAQIKLDRVPNGFPASSRAQVRQAISELEQIAHVSLLPMDVWIDSHQLVRRMRFSFNETVSGQSLAATIRIDIPQYGPQPLPALPAADQVTDLSGLSGTGG